MVDSIKSQSNLSHPRTVQTQNKTHSELRKSFKQLSSGLRVSESVKDSPAVVHVQNESRSSEQIGKLVDNLNDAVSSSVEALKALEDVANEAQGNKAPTVVKAFADDLSELKSDVVELLQNLRARADRAQVIDENMKAAEATLEDAEKVNAKAQEVRQAIGLDPEKALHAHDFGFLSIDKVMNLLDGQE